MHFFWILLISSAYDPFLPLDSLFKLEQDFMSVSSPFIWPESSNFSISESSFDGPNLTYCFNEFVPAQQLVSLSCA